MDQNLVFYIILYLKKVNRLKKSDTEHRIDIFLSFIHQYVFFFHVIKEKKVK